MQTEKKNTIEIKLNNQNYHLWFFTIQIVLQDEDQEDREPKFD